MGWVHSTRRPGSGPLARRWRRGGRRSGLAGGSRGAMREQPGDDLDRHAAADQPGRYLSCLRTSAWPSPPVWFLAGPVGHLSADRWQPASYRVPAVPRGTDAGRRSAARSPRSAFVLAGGRSQPDLRDERMSAGCPGGGVTTGSEPAPAGAAPGLGKGCARMTGGGYRQVPLPGRHAGSHLQGLRSPEGDAGVVEGDLLICCEPQPRAGRRRGKQGSAVTSTPGALPARNRPVTVSRGDGSPGRGPAGSPSGGIAAWTGSSPFSILSFP
jgi:hypothetical protein